MVSIVVDDELLLRTYTPADAQELYDVVNASRRHLHTWLSWVDSTTRPEHSLQFIQQSLQDIDNQQGLALGIYYNGDLVGGVGMHHWDHATRRAQVGYWICESQEGKGIMTRCMKEFITYLFDKIGLNKTEIHFLPGNERSAKLAERLGFQVEGIIRHSVMRNGMPHDMVIMGLLKNETLL